MLFPRAAAFSTAPSWRQLLAFWFSLTAAFTAPALAEDPPRRVGSLNYISGDVSYALRAEPGEPNADKPENWLQADFNQPVCQDMSLRTGAMARARVRIGPDAIQLADDTSFNLLNLTDQLIEASVPQGRIYLQVTSLEPGESIELETPRGSLWVLRAGAYDLNIGRGDEPTRIVVFEGQARFVGGAADLPISAGKEAEVSGAYPGIVTTMRDWTGLNPAQPLAAPTPRLDAAPFTPPPATAPAFATAPAPLAAEAAEAGDKAAQTAAQSFPAAPPAATAPEDNPRATPADATLSSKPGAPSKTAKPEIVTADAQQKPADEFLLWVEQSNEDRPQAAKSTRYVSAETTGSDALDRYGRWDTLPDAGPVWFPTSVPEGWAPYRFGHWDWIDPWGWTWVDDQPWGFAPFHYGRWVNIGGRWGWLPGGVEAHPVYAPALVAFVDAPEDSGGVPDGASGGGPDVGWFPLGPDDAYTPWYRAGPDYVASLNAPEHGRFRDWGPRVGEHGREAWRGTYFNRRFATIVSRQAFAEAHRIDRAMVRQVAAERLEHAAVMRGAPRIMPVVMRGPAGAGELRGGVFHGAMPAAAAAGGLHVRPGGGFEHDSPIAGRGGPNARPGGERPQIFGRPEAGRGAIENRGAAASYGRAEPGRGMPPAFHGEARPGGRSQLFPATAQGAHGGPQQFARPEASPGFHGGPQQFARPEASPGFRGGPQQFARPEASPGFRGGPQQFARPEASPGFRGGPQQFARPEASPGFRGGPQQFARPGAAPGFRGAPQQFARPQVAQGFRGGAASFGRPQAFQTPAAARGPMMGRAAPQIAARPAVHVSGGGGGGGGGRHK